MPVHANVDTFICNSLRIDYSSIISCSSFLTEGFMVIVVSKIFPATNGTYMSVQAIHDTARMDSRAGARRVLPPSRAQCNPVSAGG